jgi:hypothetical protein
MGLAILWDIIVRPSEILQGRAPPDFVGGT